jgi:hypothetical protein
LNKERNLDIPIFEKKVGGGGVLAMMFRSIHCIMLS